jgi:hypothetical protein
MPKSRRPATGSGHCMSRARTPARRRALLAPLVQASLGAAQAQCRSLQFALVNSRHQRVKRAEISGFQFQAVHRGLLNGRMPRESVADGREDGRSAGVNRLRLS